MTKFCLITDVHANLPALAAALGAIQQEGYDRLIHLGDVVAIGPQPAECLDLLLNTPRISFIMGNHDAWLAEGLPQPRPPWLSAGEVRHQQWTHAQIDPSLKEVVSAWPYYEEVVVENVPVALVHYALDSSGRNFKQIVREPTPLVLDYLFAAHDTELIFYGHHHPFSDEQGASRYINPGSLGCHTEAVARYTIAEFANGRYTITHKMVTYDDTALKRAFQERAVPERDFLWRVFFGGR
ncbi:MAG: metallophosphoesterase family protein [Anaerolineales bacterium]|nr:metallophosphoesterase family protein [Anaerolineales bacterium]